MLGASIDGGSYGAVRSCDPGIAICGFVSMAMAPVRPGRDLIDGIPLAPDAWHGFRRPFDARSGR